MSTAKLTFNFVVVLDNYVQRMNILIEECDYYFDEVEYDDWDDDVDETFYDPYMGCDFYDCGDCWE